MSDRPSSDDKASVIAAPQDAPVRVTAFEPALELAWVTFSDGTRCLLDFEMLLAQVQPQFFHAMVHFPGGRVANDGARINWPGGLTISARALRGETSGQRDHASWPVVLARRPATYVPWRPLQRALAWFRLPFMEPGPLRELQHHAREVLGCTARELDHIVRAQPSTSRVQVLLRLIDLGVLVQHRHGDVQDWLYAPLSDPAGDAYGVVLGQGGLDYLEYILDWEMSEACLRTLAEG